MKNYIVTIARQYGSGGRDVGRRLAALTGYRFYDNDLITMAAQKSGMSRESLNAVDEKAANSLLYTLALGSTVYNRGLEMVNIPLNDKLFVVQSEIIKELAEEEEGAIIVGRCADYVLSGRDNLVRVFVSADFDSRVDVIMERNSLNRAQAKDLVVKTDKRRSNYYSYYTGEKWGKVDNYDLMLSTSRIGLDGAAELIAEYLKRLEAQQG